MNSQKIVFVTGKGGVGKSTMALSVAEAHSKMGRKVLLVELGDTSFYENFLSFKYDGELFKYSDSIDIALWDGHNSLKKYIVHYIKINKVVDLFVENKVMKALIQAAPGLKELSLLGRITSGSRQFGPPLKYDVIVVDSYATGHFLALLRAPVGMYEVIKFGPMGRQCSEIIKILKDPINCSYVIVTLPEELPVKESLELNEQLRQEFDAKPKVVLNKSVLEDWVQNIKQDRLKDEMEKKYNIQKNSEVSLNLEFNEINKVPFIYENDGKKLTKKITEILVTSCKNLLEITK